MEPELKPVLYANLASSMAFYGLTTKDMSENAKSKLSYNRLQNMILGRTPFTLEYMLAVRDTFFPDKSIDELFKRFE